MAFTLVLQDEFKHEFYHLELQFYMSAVTSLVIHEGFVVEVRFQRNGWRLGQ